MRAGLPVWQARNGHGPGRGAAFYRRALAACCAAVGLAGLVAACAPALNVPGSSSAQPINPSIVTYAMQPDTLASYAFPFISVAEAAQASIYNINDFQYLLYRPLYWFGTGVNPYVNGQLSLAYPPVYNGDTVTIKLKPNWKWSNGEPVDAQDVVFFMNMMAAEANSPTKAWIDTTPDGLPGDVTNVRAVSQYVVTMDITTPQYSETWFTNNELSQIIPMPAAWDRTASGPSDCATNVRACDAVYDYLNAQSQDVKTYGSSPVWGVVDGPWKVKSLDTLGNLTLTFNDRYSGPVARNHITTFIEVPFTTDSAEYNVLQDPAGSQVLDVGYLPTVDAPVPPAGANVGSNPGSLASYSLDAVYPWGIRYFPYNFTNPAAGPVFGQLYFRQAFQELVDQEGVINGPLHGYGKVDIGPVAAFPVTSYLSPQLARAGDPWTLNIPKARQALLSHGWVSHGAGQPFTCGDPGPGPSQCGPGVQAHTSLSFTLMYATGIDYMESAARELASNASLAGIQITLDPEPFNNVTGTAFDPANHTWQLAEWGGWTFSPDYLPTGETLFQTGSANNTGSYDNAKNDQLIVSTLEARTPSRFDSAMYAWQNYVAGQLPVVYTPNVPVLVEAINGLNIGPQNSAYMITPEMWSYRR